MAFFARAVANNILVMCGLTLIIDGNLHGRFIVSRTDHMSHPRVFKIVLISNAEPIRMETTEETEAEI